MSGAYRAQIEDAAGAVTILSRTRHAWLGQPAEALPNHVESRLDDRAARRYLVQNVANTLYADFYCQGMAAPSLRRVGDGSDAGGDAGLVNALSAANRGSGCWDPGWTVARVANGTVAVVRDGLELLGERGACRPAAGGRIEPGTTVRVRFPKELLRLSPGFYTALGDVALPCNEPIVGLYWHLEPTGAVPFVATATRTLNDLGIAARLKIVNDAAHFDHCDAAVLYLRRDEFADARPVVAQLLARLGPWLRRATPALTKRLAPGLGLAEDPGRGQSFGHSRCDLLAEGIVRAHECGDDVVTTIVATLEEAGVDLATPYLRDGSSGDYELV